MTDWVRLWHDMPTDPKWRVIARKSGQRIGDVIAVFNFLMVAASANARERGRTHGFDAEDVAAAIDVETTDVEAILAAMQGKVIDGDRLTGWEARQPKREDNSAERGRRWRDERKRTQANAPERPETDTETDIVDGGDARAKPPAKRDLVSLGNLLAQVTGLAIDPSQDKYRDQSALMTNWLHAGGDPDEIVEVVKVELARAPDTVSGLRYFDRPVRQAIAKRRHPPNGTSHPPRSGTQRGRSDRAAEMDDAHRALCAGEFSGG